MQEVLRRVAPAAFEATPVLFAFLFGSNATGRERNSSDIDVAVYVDDDARADHVSQSLELAGRLADVSGLPRVEVVVMNDAPLPLLGSVLRDRIVIFSRDETARVRFEATTRSLAMDFDIHARRLDRELLARTADGSR